jgi:hypothetical protein
MTLDLYMKHIPHIALYFKEAKSSIVLMSPFAYLDRETQKNSIV